MTTHKVRLWAACGVRVAPPSAVDSMSIYLLQFVLDVRIDLDGGQVEDSDGQGLQKDIVYLTSALVRVAEEVLFRSGRNRGRRHGPEAPCPPGRNVLEEAVLWNVF